MNKKLQRILLVLFIVLVNIGCDQKTKIIAQENLTDYSITSYMNDFFRIQYAENTGAFLGRGSDLPDPWHMILLKIIPVVMLAGMLLYTLFAKGVNMWQAIGMSFIVGGGMSNLYDRINYGMVVDFMNMGFGSLRTGIFNFADVAIMVGMGILIAANFKE